VQTLIFLIPTNLSILHSMLLNHVIMFIIIIIMLCPQSHNSIAFVYTNSVKNLEFQIIQTLIFIYPNFHPIGPILSVISTINHFPQSMFMQRSLFHNQNCPERTKSPGWVKFGSHRLAGVHNRQTIHIKPRKLGGTTCIAWRPVHAAKRFLTETQNLHIKGMNRLAALQAH